MAIYLSASLIEDYVSCNRKVYYRSLKGEGAVPNKEMIIGDIVHGAIENHWSNQANCMTFVEYETRQRLPDEFATSFGFATTCVENFFEKFQPFLSKEDDIEKKFKIPYGKDVFIVGRMDRISNGSVFDWKTARRPQTDISGSIQFILYNWAYEKMFGKSPAGVYYGALSNGSIVMYKHDVIAETTLFSDLIPDVINSIRTKNYTPNGIFRKACFRCSYADMCLKEIRDELDYTAFTKK